MAGMIAGSVAPSAVQAAVIYAIDALPNVTSGTTSGTITLSTTVKNSVNVTNTGGSPTQLSFVPTGFDNILVGQAAASRSSTYYISNVIQQAPYNLPNNEGSVIMSFTNPTGVTTVLTNAQLGGGGKANTQTLTVTSVSPFGTSFRGQSVIGTVTASGYASGAIGYGTTTTPDLTVVGFATKGVAPQASNTGATVYQLANSNTSTSATFTLKNVGDGNLAGADNGTNFLSNLRGSSTQSLGTGWTGTAASPTNLTDSSSQTSTFVYRAQATRQTNTTTITTSLTNGSTDGFNKSQTLTTTLTGITVAPVQSVTGGNTTIYVLPGASSTATFKIANVGDGSFVNTTLDGTLTTTVTGIGLAGSVSSPTNFGLADGATGPAATTLTQTMTYTGQAVRGSSAAATITANFANGGTLGNNASGTATVTVTGRTVAPVQSTTATNTTIYALPGQAGTTQGTFIIKNTGDGSLAGATLAGTLTTTNGSGFSGTVTSPTTIGLHDGVTGAAATTLTQTLTYTGGASKGATSTSSVVASFTNGNSNNSNTAQSVTQTFTGQTVAPIASTSTTGTGTTQYVLVGSGATVTGSLTVKNVGDGTLAGANLTGTLANTVGAGFSTTTAAGTINLGDSNAPGLNGTSLTQTLTYTAESTRSGVVRTASSVATFNNGRADGTNSAAASVTVALSAQSVAPLASVTASLDAGTVRVGETNTVSLVVKNTGDGNLAGADSPTLKSNLHGAVGTGSGSFSGTGGTVNLTDSSSSTYLFTYAPTARTNGLSESVAVTTTLANGSTSANLSGSTTTTLSAKAVGPVYQSSYTTNASPTVTTGTGANAGEVYGGTITFGDAVGGLTTQSLLISNITSDLGKTNATTLSLTGITITGGGEYSFTLNGFNENYSNAAATSASIRSNDNGGIAGAISIQFSQLIGNSSQLRIQTDEGVAFGSGTGTIYVYDLRWTVPEPGTVMVFGAGLLGLAISRRNRRGKAEAMRLTAVDGSASRA